MPLDPVPAEASSFHQFEVDENIVNDLIYRQNGTVATALGELVMNAIDAGTKKIEILINAEGFEIRDNGTGFADEESVMRFFKRFGTPHAEGDATFGRFRIGRGQIMAFAKTTWHSRTFKMTTDLESGQKGFAFEKDVPAYSGCKVSGKFYKALSSYDLSKVHEGLSDRVRYVSTPVFINQIQVNPQEKLRWDYEDDQIKIAFNPQGRYSLKLYSLGVFVKELHIHQYGFQADVVTKQALKLNMARNEVNQDDPLWLHVHAVLREEMRKRKRGAKTLSENERSALIDQLMFDEVALRDVISLPLLKDVRGKSTSILVELRKKRPWSAMVGLTTELRDKRLGDQVSAGGSALVLSKEELDLWQCDSIESLLSRLKQSIKTSEVRRKESERDSRHLDIYYMGLLQEVRVVEFSLLAKGLSSKYDLIKQSDLTALERAQRNALQYALDIATGRLAKTREIEVTKRKLFIGDGLATAWTDSSTYVAVNRSALTYFENGIPGLLQLCAILLHELTHESGSVLDNGHDHAFYEHFHDAVLCGPIGNDVLGSSVQSLQSRYSVELQRAKLPMPKWMDNDELITVTLGLNATKPTKLLTWFLKEAGLAHTLGRGEVRIQAYMDQLWNMDVAVRKIKATLFRRHKLKHLKSEDLSHIEDFRERASLLSADAKRLLYKALELEGVDNSDSTVEVLNDFSLPREEMGDWRIRMSHLRMGNLAVLTSAPAFGVDYVESIRRQEVKSMAGKDFFVARAASRRETIDACKLVSEGVEGRLAAHKEALDSLLSGIINPQERMEFANRFLSEEFNKTLR